MNAFAAAQHGCQSFCTKTRTYRDCISGTTGYGRPPPLLVQSCLPPQTAFDQARLGSDIGRADSAPLFQRYPLENTTPCPESGGQRDHCTQCRQQAWPSAWGNSRCQSYGSHRARISRTFPAFCQGIGFRRSRTLSRTLRSNMWDPLTSMGVPARASRAETPRPVGSGQTTIRYPPTHRPFRSVAAAGHWSEQGSRRYLRNLPGLRVRSICCACSS